MQPRNSSYRPASGMQRPGAAEFQSSSGQKAGCNPVAGQRHSPLSTYLPVSILIRPEGRMQPPWYVGCQVGYQFQSSSGQKAGCNPAVGQPPTKGRHRCSFYVSILIRPEGRMQPRGCSPQPWATVAMFQSSSGQKAGCNRWDRPACPVIRFFNPHPARRPDATRLVWSFFHAPSRVSILIRPEGRMQPTHDQGFQSSWLQQVYRDHVSILIRPEGRMQHRFDWTHAGHTVSILIRPEGRMQRR